MVRAIGQAGATPMIVLITGGASAASAVGGPTSGSSFATDTRVRVGRTQVEVLKLD